jgi:DNA polymerase III, alpha subunit
MTALLSQSKNESEKVALYVADCRAMGIDVLPPDVNYSGWDFEIEDTPEGKPVIRFGLGAVKNVGQNSVEVITGARESGKFKDINDFSRRVDLRKVGRRALESLIRVGALDVFADRRALLDGLEKIMSISESHFRARDAGQLSIFGFVEGLEEEVHLPKVAELDQREKLEWEHELLGIYLSDHPLAPYMPVIRKRASHLIVQLREAPHQSEVLVGGTIGQLRTIVTKKGSEMAFATLDDIQGSVELVIFPRVWSKYAELLRSNDPLMIKGKADNEKSDPKILVDKVERIQLTDEDLASASEESPVDYAPVSDENDDPFAGLGIADNELSAGNEGIALSVEAYLTAEPVIETIKPIPLDGNQSLEMVEVTVASPIPVAQPAGALSPIKPEDSRILLLQLTSCGSRDRDNRRLKQIYGFLTSTPGKDRFAFICKENGQSYRLDFPNDNTNINDSLLREVKGIVGESNVIIEE